MFSGRRYEYNRRPACAHSFLERCRSGRTDLIRNQTDLHGSLGFKSLPLRQLSSVCTGYKAVDDAVPSSVPSLLLGRQVRIAVAPPHDPATQGHNQWPHSFQNHQTQTPPTRVPPLCQKGVPSPYYILFHSNDVQFCTFWFQLRLWDTPPSLSELKQGG